MQLPLSADWDLTADGKVQLDISVIANSVRADQDGLHEYVAYVTEMGSVETPLSTDLGTAVAARQGLSRPSTSIDSLQAVRGIDRLRTSSVEYVLPLF